MIQPDSRDIVRTFTFLPMESVVSGSGSVARLGSLLASMNVKRALLITGPTLFGNAALMMRVKQASEGRIVGVFSESRPHVPRGAVLAAVRLARELHCDGLVSFGGGSPNDTAKAVGMALAEGLDAIGDFDRLAARFTYPDEVVVPQIAGDVPPIVAIPTTLSAGEFTHFAGVTSEELKVKQLYIDAKMTARVVILDPELTLDTPSWLWSSTGIRSVDHAVEALCSSSAHPYTDGLALHALRILSTDLRRCHADPSDVSARLQCQIGAWISVCGLANVTLGLSHGIGHQLGARCGVPHGLTSCVMMGEVMRFNRAHIGMRASWILGALGEPATGQKDNDGLAAARAIETLISDLGQPTRLRDVGVTPDQFSDLATDALEDLIVATNARPVTSRQELVELLERAY